MAKKEKERKVDSCVREQNRQRSEAEERKERWRLKKEERTCMRADECEKGTITLVAARGRDRVKEKEKARDKDRENESQAYGGKEE